MTMRWVHRKARCSTAHSGTRGRLAAFTGVGVMLMGATMVATADDEWSRRHADWPMFGQNLANTSSTTLHGDSLSREKVHQLKLRWSFTTGGDVSARAAVVDGVAYFPDWGGNIWAVDAHSGALIWGHQLSDYGLTAGTVSRTSPAVAHGMVYIGTQFNAAAPTGKTGWLLAINAATGDLVWAMQPDTSNPFPVITASPAVAKDIVVVGMTSNEEFVAIDPSYPCCSVVGSVVAVNAFTGKKLWQTFTAPAAYSGANVWGSNPVIDTDRNTVFVGTGNNYHRPPAYDACIANGGTPATCLPARDHADSVIALSLTTGKIKWAKRLMDWDQQFLGVADNSDFWNVGCIPLPPTNKPGINCPSAAGPDYDVGTAPNEITYWTDHGPKTIIGAGQKSGIYYALDPDTGAELWHTQVGPGSTLGGIEWGCASDGRRIYVAIANLYGIPYAAFGLPSTLGGAGSWAALDPATGKILWQTPDPNMGLDLGPLAVANGVVYAPSMGGASSETAHTMFALDSATGNTLWSFAAGSSVIAGAAIAGKTVYWGSGYSHLGSFLGSGNNKFYAFSAKDEDE